MASQDKLIKTGIKYTDSLFEIIKRRVTHDLEHSKDLEDFLIRTKDFMIDNPLITTGYQETMTELILHALNFTEFARASQRELVRITIQDTVAELIKNVGEDLRQKVRDIVKEGYDEGLHSHEMAKQIEKEIDTINHTRARTIARTEVARTQTVSDYVVNRERGASGFVVQCRPDCCPLCAKEYAESTPQPEGERLIGGEKRYSMNDTDKLPPLHPNCRCSVIYLYESEEHNRIRSQIHVID